MQYITILASKQQVDSALKEIKNFNSVVEMSYKNHLVEFDDDTDATKAFKKLSENKDFRIIRHVDIS